MSLADVIYVPESPAHDADIEAINDEAFGPGRFVRAAYRIREGGPVRADDNVETLKTRLKVYRDQTAPILPYYKAKGRVRSLDGLQPIETVSRALEAALELR